VGAPNSSVGRGRPKQVGRLDLECVGELAHGVEPCTAANLEPGNRPQAHGSVKLEYDPEVNAAYIRLRPVAVASTQEIAPGVIMDLGSDGRPVGFELLDASQVLGGQPQGVEFELLSRALTSERPWVATG